MKVGKEQNRRAFLLLMWLALPAPPAAAQQFPSQQRGLSADTAERQVPQPGPPRRLSSLCGRIVAGVLLARPPEDDARDLGEMADRLESGEATSRWGAAGDVVRKYPEHQQAATRQRLNRKFKAEQALLMTAARGGGSYEPTVERGGSG